MPPHVLHLCSTVGPMARGGGVDITGNDAGQGFTSTSTCTHVQGVRGAPTLRRRRAADGRRRLLSDATVRECPITTRSKAIPALSGAT